MKLPIGQPIIRSYPVHLCHLSIISHNRDFEPWFFSNYIQISCPPEFPYDRTKIINFFDYDYYNPFYASSPFASELRTERLKIPGKIISDFLEALENNIYLHIYVDDFYIPFRSAYKIKNRPHELFIYGYDMSNKIFHVLGYDKNGKPQKMTLTFEVVEQAYVGGNFILENGYKNCEWMHLDYQLSYTSTQYNLNLKRIINSLKSYLDSTEFNLMPGTVTGLNVYKLLKEYYNNYINNRTTFDVRAFHVLWEHKNVMYQRVRYLEEKMPFNMNTLTTRLFKLQNDYLILRNSLIKNELTKKRIDNKQFCGLIDSLVDRESQILSELFVELKFNSRLEVSQLQERRSE